jgi:hypothetical protein
MAHIHHRMVDIFEMMLIEEYDQAQAMSLSCFTSFNSLFILNIDLFIFNARLLNYCCYLSDIIGPVRPSRMKKTSITRRVRSIQPHILAIVGL